MSAADSLTPSLIKKLVVTTTLALLALAYTRPALSTEAASSEASAVCFGGHSSTSATPRIAVDLKSADARGQRHHRRAPQVRVSMETSFDPATRLVSVALQPKDSTGEFLSSFRPADFVVYENGVRQADAHVTIERPAVTIGILIEHGGRYPMLNQALSEATSSAANAFAAELRPGDHVSLWTYGDKLKQVTWLSQQGSTLTDALSRMDGPLPLSESNLYDALIGALAKMRTVHSPKALLLISSGVDTFSRASLPEVLQAVQCSGVPVYVIDIAPLLRQEVVVGLDTGPYGRLDWNRAKSTLARIAEESGGRLYVPSSVLDLSGDYDDLTENVRARYLVTYRSQSREGEGSVRTVRVELRAPADAGLVRLAPSMPVAVAVHGTYAPGSLVAGSGAPTPSNAAKGGKL